MLPYNKNMERLPRHARSPFLLFITISGFVLLAAYVNIVPPDTMLRVSAGITIASVSFTLLVRYITRSSRQSLLLGAGVFIFLFLRYMGLRSILYTILLLVSIVVLELYFRRR